MPESSIPRKRSRGAAMLLSLGLPGLGELYAGKPRAAGITFAIFCALTAISIGSVFAPLPGVVVVLLPLTAAVAAWVITLVRAARAARQASEPYSLRAYNRWYWYLLGVLIGVFVLRPATVRLIRSQWLQAFRIPSAAMEPTLLVGDFIFASMRPPDRQAHRNDIVVFESPNDVGLLVIKRVVGLPGDTLMMRNGALVVNGVSLHEAFVQSTDSVGAVGESLERGRAWHVAHLVQRAVATYRPTMRNWGPLVIPRDSVFLLGDNRDESFDSRFYGAVGLDRIRGRPLKIYFSFGSQDGHSSVRWARIGHRF